MIVKYYGVEDNVCEWNYLQGIIKHLTDKVDTLTLHIVSVTPEWDRRDEVVLNKTTRNVILAMHDEYMTDCILDEWKNRDDVLVFKSYLLPEQAESNVFPLPLGYNKKHKKLKNRPIIDRPVDVFFSGHMSSQNRVNYMTPIIKFFDQIDQSKRPKLDINITKGFNMGFNPSEYSERLHSSKIVICPAGNVSMETFRHYEGLRSGTVVVSPRLPQNEIYKDNYIVQVDNWDKDVGNVIVDLLSDLDMLQLVKDRQDTDYSTRYSIKAVAEYISNKL